MDGKETVVVGQSDLADSAAGVEYDFTWTASNAGTVEYFCGTGGAEGREGVEGGREEKGDEKKKRS